MITLAGYVVKEQLAESAHSTLYRGYRVQDHTPVILKVLNQEYPTPEELARFKREYELTRTMKIDGVIQAYSLEQYRHSLALVLEDFGGESLAKTLTSHKFTVLEFLRLALQITEVLRHIHHHYIIHKDLNPANILWNATTGQIKIIDFGISTKLSPQQSAILTPGKLEGTLAYLSPEQTARMNREIDYRTDLYSLGVTFYEILLGFLPFQTNDPMELVHCHLAKMPPPPHKINQSIPRPISQIIVKLMAKNAEDRYQSAAGLHADLQTCLEQLEAIGQIQDFKIGQHDISERFHLPQTLYGRAVYLEQLLDAFSHIKRGTRMLVMLSGATGHGKSALAQELQRAVVARHGYFISGKFDQFQQNIPYSAFIQAFQDLIQQILIESEAQIARWKQKLLQVLGPNGQILTALIPTLELIIGKPGAASELSPRETQNRLQLVVQNFIQIFTSADHPLVIFLDDVHWADAASLRFLELLMTELETHHLLIIGAYHSDEVLEAHPLLAIIKSIEAHQTAVRHLALSALSFEDVNQLLADTLRSDVSTVFPLTEIVLKKTYGNPLFVREFLATLHERQMLTFNPDNGGWEWNLDQVQNVSLTENVAAFMVAKIQKLPPKTQYLLQIAACLGLQFDLHTLAQSQERAEIEIVAELDAAIREGVILPTDETYKYISYFNANELREFAPQVTYSFVHNRVREAANALSSEEQRRAFHLLIGRHLLHCKLHQEMREKKLADIVNHLNLGGYLMESEAEKLELARLNLQVGKQAKAAAAYRPALKYLTIGMALLGQHCWQNYYELTLNLHKERAQLEYLHGNFIQSEELLWLALEKARSNVEQAELYSVLIVQYTLRGQYEEAIRAGTLALDLLGIVIPTKSLHTALNEEFDVLKGHLKGRHLTELVQEPDMKNPEKRMAMHVLDKLMLTTFQSNRTLFRIILMKMVNLSLAFGHVPEEAFSYAQYGALLGAMTDNYKGGYQFGALALKLSERFGDEAQKCKTLFSLAGDLTCWVKPFGLVHEFENEAYQAGLHAGELQFVGLTLMHKTMHLFYEGSNLEQLDGNIPRFLLFTQKTQNQIATDVISGYQAVIRNLRGVTAERYSFENEVLNEEEYIRGCREHHNPLALCLYRIAKAQALYLHGDPATALQLCLDAERRLASIQTFFARSQHNLYLSLCMTMMYPSVPQDTQREFQKRLDANQKQMKRWMEHCPENFSHAYLLVEAERTQFSKQPLTAMHLYQQAIQAAHTHGFIHHEALAHELAGQFYLQQGFNDFANLHLHKASRNYGFWGAQRKVDELNGQYPHLLGGQAAEDQRKAHFSSLQRSTSITLSTSGEGLSVLDLETVMKASQAISGEIVLPRLLNRMMKIVLESAGAQKGWLILQKKGQWVIEAESSVDKKEVQVLQSQPIDSPLPGQSACCLPVSVIQYVARTGEYVVLSDAAHEGKFTQDPYISEHQLASVLCAPLIKRTNITGILYLENNMTPGAFTTNRLEVLNLLSSQMSISIENARLYKELEEALSYQVEMTNAYSRFVPREFLSLLDKESIVDVHLGEQVEKEITVMFCDIRGFTSLSEQMTPQENFNFINSYLSRMGPIISQHHGFIDKYIGDAIMALFPTHADDAVKCAVAMLNTLKIYNQHRQKSGYPPIRIGIGLNTGMLMLGTVGEQHRMDGTVISDAVNLASRIEGMTKVYGVSLLISETTYFQLTNASHYSIRIIDQLQAKGKSEPVTIFEVYDGDPPEMANLKTQTLMMFKQGFKLYHQTKFAEAQALFSDVLQINPEDRAANIADAKALFLEVLHGNPADKAAKVYIRRCEQIEKYGFSREWAGIWAWIDTLRGK